jgi:hypothetical protein
MVTSRRHDEVIGWAASSFYLCDGKLRELSGIAVFLCDATARLAELRLSAR